MKEAKRELHARARTEGLVVRELPEEVLVYDLERHKAICLNRTAALVWKLCDGRTSVAALARTIGEQLRSPVPQEVVWLALEQLERDRLLVARPAQRAGGAKVSRRELMRRMGTVAAITLPVVTAIVAPTAAQAASCKPTGAACTSSAECCSGVCAGTACA